LLKPTGFRFLYLRFVKIRPKYGDLRGMLMRYAVIVGMAAAALWVAVHLSTSQANRVLVDAGQGAPPANLSLWILGLVATFTILSLGRFVIFGLPSMMEDWYRGNKSWLLVAGGTALIYGVFYLM
jgi:hypothetical protein